MKKKGGEKNPNKEKTNKFPTQQYTLQTSETVETFLLPYENKSRQFKETNFLDTSKKNPIEIVKYSNKGKYLLVIQKYKMIMIENDASPSNNKAIVDESNIEHKTLWSKDESSVQEIQFSPKDTFIVSLQKYVEESTEGNLVVWNTVSGKKVYDCKYNPPLDYSWPIIHWTFDESIAGLRKKSHIQFFKGKTMQEDLRKSIKCDQFSMARRNYFACYKKKNSNGFGNVKIFKHGNHSKSQNAVSFSPVDDVELLWSKNSTCLITRTYTQLDKTNQSYYGGSKLYFLKAKGNSCQLRLSKKGSIHDVKWSPKVNEFIVIYGTSPPKATLFDSNLDIVYDFGEGNRNRVIWNPFGRLICLAGIGNMVGEIEFWNRDNLQKIGYCKAEFPSKLVWAPSGRLLFSATLRSTLNVSNGFQVWKYNGKLLQKKKYDKLFNLEFKPDMTYKTYPTKTPSPRGLKQGKSNVKKKEITKKYVPPHMRSSEPETKKKKKKNKKKNKKKTESVGQNK